MSTLLITGGAGFIGSNFIEYLLNMYKNYNVVNLDKLTYAGDLRNVEKVSQHANYRFIQGDICNRSLVEGIFNEYEINGVIHFAAESHVDNSISSPEAFIETNVKGTFVLIDVAKNYWMDKPFVYKERFRNSRFHHISTDEVYGSLGEEGYFTENSPYAPNSPYSASKASSDMIVRSYSHTFGLNTVISNSSNNYGPKQHSEKLIPLIIHKAINLQSIPIYGDGKNKRDWIYVLDHCKAIDLVYHHGKTGESYNIGGVNERENVSIANEICSILDEIAPHYKKNSSVSSYKELITFVEDRAGHDRRYAIDSTKMKNELGWMQEEDLSSGLYKTVEWYLDHA